MPPKRKTLRFHCHWRGKNCNRTCSTNPYVVLQPFLRDASTQKKYRFTALPASAALFNKPDASDIKLIIGDGCYYAHRNILGAASEVFASMLGRDWAENGKSELDLQEDPECVKVFDRFLYFIYSGNVVLSDTNVVPLFMLADKYNVSSLYDECIKVIENGLKVFVVPEGRLPNPMTVEGGNFDAGCSSSSDSSDSTEYIDYGEMGEDNDDHTPQNPFRLSGLVPSVAELSHGRSEEGSSSRFGEGASSRIADVPKLVDGPSKTKMVASETFPVVLVLKMLQYSHNERIHQAALFNLEARVGNQICQGNYNAIWNDLSIDIVTKMLADSRFCYPEISLFEAATIWMNAKPERTTVDVIEKVMSHIRFPLLNTHDLYKVTKDAFVQKSAKILTKVDNAIKFQLFVHCCTAEDLQKWSGPEFKKRHVF